MLLNQAFDKSLNCYDHKAGITAEQMLRLTHAIRVGGNSRPAAVIFDWDRTLTVLEGTVGNSVAAVRSGDGRNGVLVLLLVLLLMMMMMMTVVVVVWWWRWYQ